MNELYTHAHRTFLLFLIFDHLLVDVLEQRERERKKNERMV